MVARMDEIFCIGSAREVSWLFDLPRKPCDLKGYLMGHDSKKEVKYLNRLPRRGPTGYGKDAILSWRRP